MDREAIINIIESAIKSGDKMPGIFDLPKVMSMKSELQACASIDAVLGTLEKHRDMIARVFGLSGETIESAVQKIRALKT